MITADEFTPDYVADLASQNGMTIQPKSVRFNEAGLDYLVAFATATDGKRWVLRFPRRPDVWPRSRMKPRSWTLSRTRSPPRSPTGGSGTAP